MVTPEQYIIIITVVWDYFNDHIILNTKYICYYISPTTVNKNNIQLHNTSCGVYVYPTRGHLSLKCTIHICYILLQITRQFLLFFINTIIIRLARECVFELYLNGYLIRYLNNVYTYYAQCKILYIILIIGTWSASS